VQALAVPAVRVFERGDDALAIALDLLDGRVERQVGKADLVDVVEARARQVLRRLGVVDVADSIFAPSPRRGSSAFLMFASSEVSAFTQDAIRAVAASRASFVFNMVWLS
jgi:hypothetical protein